MIDAHTKLAEVFPLSSAKSSSTIDCLTETFSRLGIPNIIASDNGSTFTSNEFKDLTKRNGIKHITTAPFHPATNGVAERFLKSFKIAMKAAKNDTGTLSQKISRFLFAYRNAPQSTTHESPAFLMFGRRLHYRLDLLRPNMDIQNRLTKNYSNVKLREFQVGDSVLARDYRANQEKWQYGVIKSKTGPLMYTVEIYPGMDGRGWKWTWFETVAIKTTLWRSYHRIRQPSFSTAIICLLYMLIILDHSPNIPQDDRG
uniref:Integrase catalytic domain-containing protein n=1 Tax=Biomphalaria glabrata TaxID=6526 RepID=A0A2C9KA77_BIOGL